MFQTLPQRSPTEPEPSCQRLYRQQGILVIETEPLTEFDIDTLSPWRE